MTNSTGSTKLLTKRADGFHEDANGNVACVMQVRSGSLGGGQGSWFEFKASFDAEPVRVEWPNDQPVVLFPQDITAVMLRKKYARLPTEDEVEQLEAAYAAWLAQQPDAEPAPAPQPAVSEAPAEPPAATPAQTPPTPPAAPPAPAPAPSKE